MPRFLDTRGNTKIAIAICGRCSRKFPYSELVEDPNYPGLWVCPEDRDDLDPYRLPARQTEDITLSHPRPDVALTDFQPTALFGDQIINPHVGTAPLLGSPVTALGPVRVWQPNTFYNKGDTVVPQDVDLESVPLPQQWLVCLESGFSGPTPPTFPERSGVLFRES